jgi:predicted nucleotidyltransferase
MEEQEAILFQLVTALQEGIEERLVTVVLYGSRARNQARKASDWDLFVIATDLPARLRERHILFKRILPAVYRGAVSLLAKTPQKFEKKFPPRIWTLPKMGKFSLTPKDMLTSA